MSDTCRDDLDYILQSPLGDSPDLHLSSRGAVANYLRFADEIAAMLAPAGGLGSPPGVAPPASSTGAVRAAR